MERRNTMFSLPFPSSTSSLEFLGCLVSIHFENHFLFCLHYFSKYIPDYLSIFVVPSNLSCSKNASVCLDSFASLSRHSFV